MIRRVLSELVGLENVKLIIKTSIIILTVSILLAFIRGIIFIGKEV